MGVKDLTHRSPTWPVLTEYDQDHLSQVALPLGGIGTGTVSLGGRGDLRDWEIVNRPAKGFTPVMYHANRCSPFFCLRAQEEGGNAVTRALEGRLAPPFEGAMGSVVPNHGLPRFRHCAFLAAYPFGQVLLSDPAVPLDVRIEAFNPLIPGDVDRSSIPVAILRYVLINRRPKPVHASVCGSILNFIGNDGNSGKPRKNRNSFRAEESLRGLFLYSEEVDRSAEQWGTVALTTLSDGEISYRTSWANVSWGDALLHFWDEFSSTGRLTERRVDPPDSPMGSLSVGITLAPGEERAITFLLTWHFPNRQTWTPVPADTADQCCSEGGCCKPETANRVGNYYTTIYRDAWHVGREVAQHLDALEFDTLRFVKAFCSSDLPKPVKEAALYNISTLRTQTCFRTDDGYFYGFEGCGDRAGCCAGSCTHVWNYEQTTAFLFPDLARLMREVEFEHATDERGHMSFRVYLPISRAQEFGIAAADGQMGCIMKLYREWQLSGDDEFLKKLWPKAKKALAFAWCPGGWDADQDGVMEGCQHNTLDVEYYGPNPLMATWYLGALRAGEEIARYLGDTAFADKCRDLFRRGAEWVDDHLFNGEYYEHEVRPPTPGQVIADGLKHPGSPPPSGEPPHQIGPGCLVDQLAGQLMAHVIGLGYLLDPVNVRRTLESIYRYNFKEDLSDHFNHMRSYALGDEQGLVMCTYPRGGRPARPTPYFNELMTGFEYTAAIHMLYEGLIEQGLRCIEAIRKRYDGRKRNPFNEAECGYHYARAMISWAAVLGLSGFQWSGVTRTMAFKEFSGSRFWSIGSAWGTCSQTEVSGKTVTTLEVLHGSLEIKRLLITGRGEVDFGTPKVIAAGQVLTVKVG